MTRLSIALAILAFLAAVPTLAESPDDNNLNQTLSVSPNQVTPTPEMWFYEQYQREMQDPKAAVRRKAEAVAAQRRARIAAMRWFGFSNQRPQCGSDPYHGIYSPLWVGNNWHYPQRWNGVGRPTVVIEQNASPATY